MTTILRRSALASALALALSQATAAPVDLRTAVPAQRPDIDTIAVAATLPDLLILRGGAYDPASQRLDLHLSGAADVVSSRYAIFQFHADAMESGRKALEMQGASVVGYVPNNAYLVRLNNTSLDALKRSVGVRAAEPYAAGQKIDPRLWTDVRSQLLQQVPEDAPGSNQLLDIVTVRGFQGESSAQIEAALHKVVPNVRVTSRSLRADASPYVTAGVPRDQLNDLLRAASALDSVVYIEPWFPNRLHNAASIGAIQGNFVGSCGGNGPICPPSPMFDHDIMGSGQIVAVADSGTSPWVAYFTTLNKGAGALTQITLSDNPAPVPPAIGILYPDRKIIGYWLQPTSGAVGPVDYDFTSGHGTHTSGTVVGDLSGTFTNSYLASTPTEPNHEESDGMAPNAQLLMQDVGGTASTSVYISDFAGTLNQAYAGGARVHNNSWGAETAGQYNGNDAEADQTSWNNENMLVVVSAGNDNPGAVQTGSPSNGKNVLSVAALGHAGSTAVASYSNRGPAADGRMKPDIAAPGSAVLSARNTSTSSATPVYNTPVSNSGTSMAAPTISGNAALVRQYFADGFYPRGQKTAADAYNPSGMVMKAVLLNGTNPLGAPSWPNANSGWGRAWLDGNLWFKTTLTGGNDNRRLRIFERTQAAGLQTGDVNEYTISNVGAGQELRITLTWFDPAASAGAALTLINNLDLEVVAPDAQVYKGNVFASGVSVAGGSADARDTVEQVRFTAPQAGSYTIRVKATSVPGSGIPGSDTQGYAVAASGAFALPDPAPAAAPTGVNVASNNSSGVAIGFSSAALPQGFQLYRANGTCATAAAGDFRLVAKGAASPVVDDSSQGGFQYAYKVRGISGDVEGQVSGCVDAISADDCTLQPTINAASLDLDGSNANCSIEADWSAATASCPGSSGMTYNVFRSSDPFMASSTEIASDLPDTDYTDFAVVNGQAYYYRFQAEDSLGNASSLSAIVGATTTGATGPDPDPFVDNVENATYLEAELPWGVSNIAAANGTLSYHTGGQASNHPDLTCASIETPALLIPANGRLSFSARYDLEFQWDGVVTEISTNGGSSWSSLPPDGGYPTVFNTGSAGTINACGFPNGTGIYSGVTTAGSNADPNNGTATAIFKPFTINLSSFAGQTVNIRWRLSSDPGLNFSGFFLDQVRIGNADSIFDNDFDMSVYMCQEQVL